jgi:competence protein ComEC
MDVHVLDVGAGSCVVLDHASGRQTMVDMNDGRRLRTYEREELARRPTGALQALLEEAMLPDPVAWFSARFGRLLHRFIISHPDADHFAGLRRLLGGELTVENIWDLPHVRLRLPEGAGADARDWDAYQRFRRGVVVTPVRRLTPLAGQVGEWWTADGIEILSPTPLEVLTDGLLQRYNDMSYVLRISHAGRTVLLPGDVESRGWRRMLARNVNLAADVLIASHHGRRNGYDEVAMAAIAPRYVVASTGPLSATEDAHRLYRARVAQGDFLSTRSHGTVSFRLQDDGRIIVATERGPRGRAPRRAPPLPPRPAAPSPAQQALLRFLRERRNR